MIIIKKILLLNLRKECVPSYEGKRFGVGRNKLISLFWPYALPKDLAVAVAAATEGNEASREERRWQPNCLESVGSSRGKLEKSIILKKVPKITTPHSNTRVTALVV